MTLSANLKRYAILTMIVSGIVLALSGLCTGIFVASGPSEFVPNALGVLWMGMIGMAPSATLFFSARHIYKNGPKLIPSILIFIVGLTLLGLALVGISNLLEEWARLRSLPLVPTILNIAIIGLAFIIVAFGLKAIGASRKTPPEPDKN